MLVVMADTMADASAPIEKQIMKKSPELSSRIRQMKNMIPHSCHMLDAKYSIIVYKFLFFVDVVM